MIEGLLTSSQLVWLIGVFFVPAMIPSLTGQSTPRGAGGRYLWSLFGAAVVLVVVDHVVFDGASGGFFRLYLGLLGSMDWLTGQIVFLAIWFVRNLVFLSVLGLVVALYSRKAASTDLASATS